MKLCELISYLLPVDRERLFENFNDNFMVKRELSLIAGGGLSLRYGKYMAIASAALITANNVELEKKLSEKVVIS